jgi:2-polyprenyl-3-methyl-5-hydroxy-6-metoxy-1,4-benzoquinol methylase
MGGRQQVNTCDTSQYYKEHGYTWQNNKDSLFQYALWFLFQKANDKIGKLNAEDRILDIGCGDGLFLDYYPQTKYTGIDISEENISLARERHPGIEFIAIDATRTNFPNEYFTHIVCIETIEHLSIETLRSLLLELQRICKKGGKIVITTPNLYYLWGVIPWSFWPIRRRITLKKLVTGIINGYVDENYNLPVHHYRFKPTFLKSLFESHFTVKNIDSTYWYNNRAIHKIYEPLQLQIMHYSGHHKFLGLNMGSQLIIELVNDKK